MTKHFHQALLAAAMLTAWAGIMAMPVSADSVVYQQNTDYNETYASQNDTTGGLGNFATSYDNFTLGSTTDITRVGWIGAYYNPQSQGTITGFTVTFYANNSGIPGTPLFTTGDVAGTAGETFLQNDNLGDPTYSYTLGTSFVATAGTKYWMSIEPDAGFPPQWGWETGTGGDGASYQCYMGTCGALTNDLAFTLYTNTTNTPEPSTLLLLSSGLFGLGFMKRKVFQS